MYKKTFIERNTEFFSELMIQPQGTLPFGDVHSLCLTRNGAWSQLKVAV